MTARIREFLNKRRESGVDVRLLGRGESEGREATAEAPGGESPVHSHPSPLLGRERARRQKGESAGRGERESDSFHSGSPFVGHHRPVTSEETTGRPGKITDGYDLANTPSFSICDVTA